MTTAMTMEEFDNKYKPKANHFADDEAILHFETFGEEDEFVKTHDNRNVWTIVESENNDNMYLVAGYRAVNRVGYIVTENQWENEDIEVLYFSESEMED